MARLRRRRPRPGAQPPPSPAVPSSEAAAFWSGSTPFQWMLQRLWLGLFGLSFALHAGITLVYGVAPVFLWAPLSLRGLPAGVWLLADAAWLVWACQAWATRRGAPRPMPDPVRTRRWLWAGACLAVVAVGLALADAEAPRWAGWSEHTLWPLWPATVALPLCLPLARAPFADAIGWVAFGALVVAGLCQRWLRWPRVFLAVLVLSLSAFAAWAMGEGCLRYGVARGVPGVEVPSLHQAYRADGADYLAWTWAIGWSAALLWGAAASLAAALWHLPAASLQQLRGWR